MSLYQDIKLQVQQTNAVRQPVEQSIQNRRNVSSFAQWQLFTPVRVRHWSEQKENNKTKQKGKK